MHNISAQSSHTVGVLLRELHSIQAWQATHQTSIDLVVTRYRESLVWLWPYMSRPGWAIFIYSTGSSIPRRICTAGATCKQIKNAGYEWHGYLRHIIDRYDSLADICIFLQGNPLTVSPDAHCLLNKTADYAPVQVLSWVQQAKRQEPLFQRCTASYLGGCRVWIEPVTAGLRPMLHGDRWLHKACRMAKRMKGGLYQFLFTQLTAEHNATVGSASAHTGVLCPARASGNLTGDGVHSLSGTGCGSSC